MGKLRPGGDYHWPTVIVADPPRDLAFAGAEIRPALLSIQVPLSAKVLSPQHPAQAAKAQPRVQPPLGIRKSVSGTHSGIPLRLSPARATPGTGWGKHVGNRTRPSLGVSAKGSAGTGWNAFSKFWRRVTGVPKVSFSKCEQGTRYPPPLFASFRTGI